MKYYQRGTPFADNVFDDVKMKKYLPKSTYRAIIYARDNLTEVPERERNKYAEVLCRWALKKGATRYTHWFLPLNNRTAGKRDCLFSIDKSYSAVLKFRGKELAGGESDASSFPSGGMRQIYEARGLTHWDCTGFPFVKDGCLYVPCTFCGAQGEVLDKKTPLLRSIKALDTQAVRMLQALGCHVRHVYCVVGAEQEYFLVDKELFDRRPDLVLTGRTLLGTAPCKGQEFNDHYFRPPNAKVAKFMQAVDEELWKLGILAKTEHNEVAPHQYELAPCYTRVNLACDYNQLTMETLKSVANEHGLACLLHEKPFNYINGSGKHNNWSLITDDDVNLLEPGDTPKQNVRFLLILAAIVKAIDDYSELLLAEISSRGNDCRLGGFEAPPQVLTVFLGAPLSRALAVATGGNWRYGVDILPKISQNTDRNRTSPFAFTGNKFEFRSVGSSASIADVNMALNVAVAESFRQFADKLERAKNVMKCVEELVTDTLQKHKRVIFDGNNYSDEWAREAKLRSLRSYTCVDAVLALTNARNINVLTRHNVLSHREVTARQQIMLEDYVNTVRAEGKVTLEMYSKHLAGDIQQYIRLLADSASKLKQANVFGNHTPLARKLCELSATADERAELLQRALNRLDDAQSLEEKAKLCRDVLVPLMTILRTSADRLEKMCPARCKSLPDYEMLLFDTCTCALPRTQ